MVAMSSSSSAAPEIVIAFETRTVESGSPGKSGVIVGAASKEKCPFKITCPPWLTAS